MTLYTIEAIARVQSRRPFIDKAKAALRVQPHGTIYELARSIGVEASTVCQAQDEIWAERRASAIRPLVREKREQTKHPAGKRSFLLLTSAEKAERTARAEAAVLADPTAKGCWLANKANCASSTIHRAKRRLRKEGRL